MQWTQTIARAMLVAGLTVGLACGGATWAQKSGGGHGGGGHKNGGNGGNGVTAGHVAGYADTQTFLYQGVGTTVIDGVKTPMLHAKAGDKDIDVLMASSHIPYFTAGGDLLTLDKVKPGQSIQAIVLEAAGKTTVLALREGPTVVIPQKTLKVYSFNTADEKITLSDPAGSTSFTCENMTVFDAGGGRKTFADVKPGMRVEATYKESPGGKVLLALRLP